MRDMVGGQREGVAVVGPLLLQHDELGFVGDRHLALEVLKRLDVVGADAGCVELAAVEGAGRVSVRQQSFYAMQVQAVKLLARHRLKVTVPEGSVLIAQEGTHRGYATVFFRACMPIERKTGRRQAATRHILGA